MTAVLVREAREKMKTTFPNPDDWEPRYLTADTVRTLGKQRLKKAWW